MRHASQVHVYVDIQRAIAAGIKFELSANGVILTSGDEKGYIPPEFFSRVVTHKGVVLREGPPIPSQTIPETSVGDIQQKTEVLVL